MLTKRSQQKELIDLGPNFYTQEEYQDCLKKLFHVNTLFGFFYSTRKLLNKFSKESTLLDLGCGGGLFLLHLSQYFPQMEMQGIDINRDAINEAKQSLSLWQKKGLASHVSFQVQSDSTSSNSSGGCFDIILTTLVCHHLSDEELVHFLQQYYLQSGKALIINDLHRHWLAQKLFACFSPWLFRNRLISHDGLISIQRGFTRSEWKELLSKANIQHYQLRWCFPFRWQIILWK